MAGETHQICVKATLAKMHPQRSEVGITQNKVRIIYRRFLPPWKRLYAHFHTQSALFADSGSAKQSSNVTYTRRRVLS